MLSGELVPMVRPLCAVRTSIPFRMAVATTALRVSSPVLNARALLREKSRINLVFAGVAFADEEGVYLSLLGSKAVAGISQLHEIEHASGRDGIPLWGALRSYGLDPLRITEAARPACDFSTYIELRIEQGSALETEKTDIGVVDAIFDIRSHALVLTGAPGHSGTTLLDARRDALRAASEAIADSFSELSDEQRRDARLTFGDIKVVPGANNVVPGLVQTVREIRTAGTPTIDQIERMVDARFLSRATEHDVRFQAHLLADDAPIALSSAIAARVEEVCRESDCSSRRIVSGPGHDAQVFASVCATGMIFVPSRNGVDHRPDEYTSPTQIRIGPEVPYQFCRALLT